MTWFVDILLNRTRWVRANGTALPDWQTVRWLTGFVLTNNESNRSLDITIDPTTAGYVPSTLTLTASLPLRIDGGASADLSANRTLSCNSASGAAAGSMSAAHFTLVNGATSSPTADRLCKRGTTGEVCGAWFATALTAVAGAGVVRCVAGNQTIIAAKGSGVATLPLFALAGGGTQLVIGDNQEVADVTAQFFGGTFKVTNSDGALDVIVADTGVSTVVIAPGAAGAAGATTIAETGIGFAGVTSLPAEVNVSADFELWGCASGSHTPTVPFLTWAKASSTLTLGGHGASTTTNVVVDAVTNVSLEVGGTKVVECTAARLGLLGASPVSQAAAYTQTYSTAARTNAFAATAAYTGQDNAQVGSVYAKAADIEALRQEVLAAVKLLNALIDDSQGIGIAG